MKKLILIIEKGEGELWGRTQYKDHLIVENAGTVEAIETTLKKLLKKQCNLDKVEFEIQYDLQTFFEEHDYLKVSSIAKYAGLNPGLVRQYTSGVKHPSVEQAKKIESAIHKLAAELQSVSLFA